MDDLYELNGIIFTWNRVKARKNLGKHGVSFEQAAEAFFDPFLKLSDKTQVDNSRGAIIAMDAKWNVLFVVHTCTENNRIRIISARKAIRRERRYYED